jgi:diacylglycerol kinase family enzyme
MSIAVIVNPVSGGVRPRQARRRVELASAVVGSVREPFSVAVTARRGHARELAAAAVLGGARLVVIWGGDGTVNEAASAVAGSRTSVAMVRGGSGNGLARELGVRRDPRRALQEALRAVPRAIDVGEFGGRLFFNVAGVGFDAQVAARFDRDASRRRGLMTYARAAAVELWTYSCANYRIDGVEHRLVLLTSVANTSQFGNGARIAPLARPDDGRLDLVVFEETSRMATICGLPRLFVGGLTRLKGFSARQIERATIESDSAMLFHVDGEPVQGGARLEAVVHPRALNVCVR